MTDGSTLVHRNHPSAIKNLLYVGTVSDSKMHHESAKIFADISKQGFSIKVVGGPDQEKLASAVRTHGGEIEVFGEVKNVAPFFEEADLFVYPLRPDHYGTGEQVILEAMASGLPVIAFDNPAERAILEKGGGVLASDLQEFINSAIKLRTEQTVSYKNISNIAVRRVKEEFGIERMSCDLVDVMLNVAEHNDSTERAYLCHGTDMDELALYALHSFFDGEEILRNNREDLALLETLVFEKIRPSLNTRDSAARWTGLSKSTPFHYQQYFPRNAHLNSLCQKITAECKSA